MDAIFYTVNDNINVLEKTLNEALTKNVLLLDSSNISSPTIRVAITDIAEFLKRNYCYIQKLSRYYFINTITIEHGGLAVVTLRVDVLMTYKEAIKSATGEIMQCDSGIFSQIDYKEKNDVQVLEYVGNDVFTDKSLVLVTAVM